MKLKAMQSIWENVRTAIFLLMCIFILKGILDIVTWKPSDAKVIEIPRTGPTVPLLNQTIYFSSDERLWGDLCKKHGYDYVRVNTIGAFIGCQKTSNFNEVPKMTANQFKNPDGSWIEYPGNPKG